MIGGKNLSSMLFQQAFDIQESKKSISYDKPFQYLIEKVFLLER